MTERESLIQLLQSSHCVELWNHNTDDFIEPNPIEKLADYLLANGVIVPPCKVGDVVYAVSLNTETNIVAVHRGYIGSIDIRSTGNYLFICHEGFDDEPYFKNICGTFEDFGKFIFLTEEEAEKALAERSGQK